MDSFRWDRVFAVSHLFSKYATINVLDNVTRTSSEQISFSVRYDPKVYIKFSFVLPAKGLPNFFNTSSFQNPNIRGTVEEWKTNMMSLAIFFTSYVLNMFRTLIYPSSGACDCVVELPHRSSCSVVIKQHSRKLLMIDILMSETCWAIRSEKK
jgi:hypothetical protein